MSWIRLSWIAFCVGLTAPALADSITECGTYEMEGYFVHPADDLNKETVAIVVEKGTLSETTIVLGAYDEAKHRDLVGTKVHARVRIEQRCVESHCTGDLLELDSLAPFARPRPFFSPRPEPTEAVKCRRAPVLPWQRPSGDDDEKDEGDR